jgi:hypothetical protein
MGYAEDVGDAHAKRQAAPMPHRALNCSTGSLARATRGMRAEAMKQVAEETRRALVIGQLTRAAPGESLRQT